MDRGSALLIACLALACLPPQGTAGGGLPDRPDPGAATAEPAQEGRREVRAPVSLVEIRIAESHPPQIFVDVTSGLPNGCARHARSAIRREGETVYVDVFNSEPVGRQIACTMIYGEKRTSHALGSEFRSGVRYTVDANGTRETFVAP